MGQRAQILTAILGFDGWKVTQTSFEAATGERVEAVGGFALLRETRLVLMAERRWLPRCSRCVATLSWRRRSPRRRTSRRLRWRCPGPNRRRGWSLPWSRGRCRRWPLGCACGSTPSSIVPPRCQRSRGVRHASRTRAGMSATITSPAFSKNQPQAGRKRGSTIHRRRITAHDGRAVRPARRRCRGRGARVRARGAFRRVN